MQELGLPKVSCFLLIEFQSKERGRYTHSDDLGKSAKRKSMRLSLLRSTTRNTRTLSPVKRISTSPAKANVLFVTGLGEDHPCSPLTCKERKSVPPVEHGSPSTASAVPVLLRQALVFEPITRGRSNRRATVSPKKQVRIAAPTALKDSGRRKSVSPSKLKCSPAIEKHCDLTLPVPYQNLAEEVKEYEVTTGDESSPQDIEDNIVPLTFGYSDEETTSSLATAPYKGLPQDPRRMNSLLQGEILLVDADSVDLVAEKTGEEEKEDDREDSVMDCVLNKVEVEGPGDIFEDHPVTADPVENFTNLDNAGEIDNYEVHIITSDHMAGRIGHIRTDGEESQPPSGMDNSASEDGPQSAIMNSPRNTIREADIKHHAPSLDISCFAEDCSQNLALQLKPLLKSISINTEEGSPKIATIGNGFTVQTETEGSIVPEEPPRITTRSIARLSDDTTMLKAFLNRAQAKKAAMDTKLTAREEKMSSVASPRRSPRKALVERSANSPSPRRQTKIAHRPGTPPSKGRLQEHLDDAVAWEDIDEISTVPLETQPMRRSARSKKLPVPVKGSAPAPGTLSLIPVRRADGTDPVILQKGNTQELAIMTRANTRRNKGQAKLPTFMLEELQLRIQEEVEQERSVTRSQTKEARKNVGWDEKLVYFQQAPETGVMIEPIEEKQPRIRRLRGLGGVNGTPAPKRTVDMPLTSPGKGTPAPKRRGKVRL